MSTSSFSGSLAVTGAAGFVGGRLVQHLLSQGRRVVAVVRTPGLTSGLPEHENLEIRVADVRIREQLDSAFDGVEGVFHCAALFNHPDRTWDDYRAVNVQGTINVLQSAYGQGVRRIVHCSTVGVATEAMPPPYSEETPYSPQPDDKYEVSKAEGEIAALEYARESKKALVVIRPAQVYGPGDKSKAKFYKMVKKGVIVQPGDTRKHLIFIDDLCDAFQLAMDVDNVEGEVFLIAGEAPVRLDDLVDIAAGRLNVPSPRVRLPAKPVTLACTAAEHIFNAVGARAPVHGRSMDFFTRTVTCDTSKARKMLGFKAKTDVETGVKLTVEWLSNAGHI